MAVIHFFPFRWSAEKDAGKRFLGQIIKLCPASVFPVLVEGGWKIGCFLRQNEQLRMAIEQCDKKGWAGFGLTSGQTGAFLKGQTHCCWARTHSTNSANPAPTLDRAYYLSCRAAMYTR